MNGNSPLALAFQSVRERIRRACEAAGRNPGSVALLAVSKTRTADEVAALAALGQHAMGENYLQEALDKQAASNVSLSWHFIGPIQSNKTRRIAEHFNWVHSVENLRIARRLSDQRPHTLPPLNICLQVNVSGEESKSGCAPEEALALAAEMAALPRLRLRGLMAIPEPTDDVALQRERFAMLRTLHAQIRTALAAQDGQSGPEDAPTPAQPLHGPGAQADRAPGTDPHGSPAAVFDTLSMGMSDDLEAAIAEGSTMVRVGTALFGPRPAKATPA